MKLILKRFLQQLKIIFSIHKVPHYMVVQVRDPRNGTGSRNTIHEVLGSYRKPAKTVMRTPGSGGFIDFGPYGTKVRFIRALRSEDFGKHNLETTLLTWKYHY